ncbi:MAG: hypothetical protein U9Q07_03815 [Planctomycetota bacterium]|nr:hypothetical protein [Planctomycetota bacterium]
MSDEKTRVVIYLDNEMVEWLHAEAVRLHCSVSQVVKQLAQAEIVKRKDDIWGDG